MASYSVNPEAVAQAEHLIDSRQYVLDSDWGQVQPRASDQNAYLKQHSWEEYARWHLGLTDGAADAVMLARGWLRNPSWAQQAARDLHDDVRWAPQYERGR